MSFDVETFHRRAVETPSHEAVEEMRSLLVDTLGDAGAEPRVDDAGNVLARKGDPETGFHAVLNTHVDTVPPHVPYERRATIPGVDEDVPERAGSDDDTATDDSEASMGDREIVHGRGACDAKGPLAALVAAFLAVEPDEGAVTLAITPDEETVQSGAAHLAGTLDADGIVVGEPTGLDVCHAARGQFEGYVELSGEAAHAAQPNDGHNAVQAATPVLSAMEAFDRDRGPGEHAALGRPTLTATTIEGGEAFNQIPANCRIGFDRRSVPPETAGEFRDGLEAYLRRHTPDGIDLSVRFAPRETPFLEAFSTSEGARIVRGLAAASGGTIRPFGAATEASYFAAHAPTVVFGPGVLADEHGPVAHAEREYVRLPDVHDAASAVRGTLSALVE